jgi:hypothetical protein
MARTVFSRGIAAMTLTLGLPLSCSNDSWGYSLPQIRRFCRFTRPYRWNVALSLKTNLFLVGSNLDPNWNLFGWYVTWFVFRNSTLSELWVMKYQNRKNYLRTPCTVQVSSSTDTELYGKWLSGKLNLCRTMEYRIWEVLPMLINHYWMLKICGQA